MDYDRAKCQERVGENGIENGLTVWILRAKWWKWNFSRNLPDRARHGEWIGGHVEWSSCLARHGEWLVAMASCTVQQLMLLSF